MLNKMTIKEFKEKLNNNKHNTCGSINKNEYYKYLDNLYKSYFKSKNNDNYHFALQFKHS